MGKAAETEMGCIKLAVQQQKLHELQQKGIKDHTKQSQYYFNELSQLISISQTRCNTQ